MTKHDVAERLVEAFRQLPSLPVFTAGRRVQAAATDGNTVAQVLNWAGLLDHDPDARKYLWAWARNRAASSSFSELCRTMGWSRATADRGRDRGARHIAELLSAKLQLSLDSEETEPAPIVRVTDLELNF